MQSYQAASRTVNADSIAPHYTSDAVLLEPGIPPIVTRDSSRAFIASFPGAKVLEATATPDAIDVHGNFAYYWGTYFERLRFAGQPPSAQYGRFVMEWRREADDVWRIHRYYRVPRPPNWTPTPSAP